MDDAVGAGAPQDQVDGGGAVAALPGQTLAQLLRGVALGRKAWLFAGSDRGGERAAFMYTLIGTAKLNDLDPQAWLADVLARIADTPQHQLEQLLPWNWQPPAALLNAA